MWNKLDSNMLVIVGMHLQQIYIYTYIYMLKSFSFMTASSIGFIYKEAMLWHMCLDMEESSGSSLDIMYILYVYKCVTRVFIQGVFDYPSLIFCTILLYNLLVFCFLNDPISTFKFDEALIVS